MSQHWWGGKGKMKQDVGPQVGKPKTFARAIDPPLMFELLAVATAYPRRKHSLLGSSNKKRSKQAQKSRPSAAIPPSSLPRQDNCRPLICGDVAAQHCRLAFWKPMLPLYCRRLLLRQTDTGTLHCCDRDPPLSEGPPLLLPVQIRRDFGFYRRADELAHI